MATLISQEFVFLKLDESITWDRQLTVQQEARILVQTSAPLILAFLLQYSLTVASIFVVGHIGEVELAAVSLASSTWAISRRNWHLTTVSDRKNHWIFSVPRTSDELGYTLRTSIRGWARAPGRSASPTYDLLFNVGNNSNRRHMAQWDSNLEENSSR